MARSITPPKESIERWLRAGAKGAIRAFGVGTSPLRPLPDFLVIGTKRGGTTSLCRYLLLHPQVLPLFPSAAHLPMAENMKGVHFFDTGQHHSVWWYRSHFRSSFSRSSARFRHGSPIMTGEASPYYLFHPQAADRAQKVVPKAKIIVLLRNPVDRAYSHYKEQRRNGREPLSFEAALQAEKERLAGAEQMLRENHRCTSFAHEHQSYAAQGEYLRPLQEWTTRFSPEQVLVLRSEDFYLSPQDAYSEVLRFLDLPAHTLDHPACWNRSPVVPMDPDTRRQLKRHFAPHVAALQEFLGRDLQWDCDST